MPKAKFRAERGSQAIARRYKYKLGNRKSSISAHTVSSDDLLKQYFSLKNPKDKPKIAKVLSLRNIPLVNPAQEEATA